jgi:hypothetical protein
LTTYCTAGFHRPLVLGRLRQWLLPPFHLLASGWARRSIGRRGLSRAGTTVGQNIVAVVADCTVLVELEAGLRDCMLDSSSDSNFGQRIACSFSVLGLDWVEISFYQFFCLER